MKMVLKFFAGLTNFDDFSDDFLISLISEDFVSVPMLSVDGIHFLFEAKQRIKALNTQLQVQCDLSWMSSPFDYYVLGYVMSHSSCKWVAKLEPGRNEKVNLMMFAKGASSNSPISVKHPVQLRILHNSPRVDDCITILNHLDSSSSHSLKRLEGLTYLGMVFCENVYELLSSLHL